MYYKIDNKYYIQVLQYYVEVNFKISNNEVTTVPTNNRINYSDDIAIEAIDGATLKKSLLEKNSKKEEKEEIKKTEYKKFNKYYK